MRLTIGDTHLRYYHAEDAAAADALAAEIGASARDFTSYTPRPDPGLIEVWVAGSRGGSVDTAKASDASAPQPLQDLANGARMVTRNLTALLSRLPPNESR